ncbi:MAG: GNAT family N-acetyltransferase, partial [Candidatus Aenigmarchaeota archaeon]|nr:GNAT family N-acetyltransferase [Candidatus Aenigmarchaeota archaeon]
AEVIGMLELWEFPEFRFVDHIAVAANRRGQGVGAKIFRRLMRPDRLLIAEAEPPTSQAARRRFTFYARLGFSINRFPYVMPAYNTEKRPVQLVIISYPRALTPPEFRKIKAVLYGQVYGHKGNGIGSSVQEL